jgi:hypothetical protein
MQPEEHQAQKALKSTIDAEQVTWTVKYQPRLPSKTICCHRILLPHCMKQSLKDAQEFPWPWLLFHLPTVQTIRRTSGLIGVHYAYWTQEHTQKYQQNLNRFCSSGNY